MEYRTVSTKLPTNELTLFRAHCEKKGVTPASLIRDLILREIKVTVPHTVAGRNKILYNKNNDSFTWLIEVDAGRIFKILENISPSYLEDLASNFNRCLDERNAFIHKKISDSVPIPSDILQSDSNDQTI